MTFNTCPHSFVHLQITLSTAKNRRDPGQLAACWPPTFPRHQTPLDTSTASMIIIHAPYIKHRTSGPSPSPRRVHNQGHHQETSITHSPKDSGAQKYPLGKSYMVLRYTFQHAFPFVYAASSLAAPHCWSGECNMIGYYRDFIHADCRSHVV
jgi:hypothetical protein